MIFDKVTLDGELVRLDPLSAAHQDGLQEAVRDGKLWMLFFTSVPSPDTIDAFYRRAETEQQSGAGLTFAIIDKASGLIAGSTRFMQADLPNKRVEIGFTFLAKRWQKSLVNTEAKLLMLRYAFEQLGMNRVEFLSDYLNADSRRAIARLGAKEEGIIRSHRVMPDGRVRDSVLFSILHNEWPGVEQLLSFKLRQERD